MDLEYEFSVLNDMMKDFDSWFPFDGTEDEEEREMYRNGFSPDASFVWNSESIPEATWII